jgi:hypothetical protein
MNTFVFGVITKRLEEIGFNVHKVFKMPEKQALFEDLYHYVRYVKPCKAELTMVALDSDELIHYGSVAKLDFIV